MPLQNGRVSRDGVVPELSCLTHPRVAVGAEPQLEIDQRCELRAAPRADVGRGGESLGVTLVQEERAWAGGMGGVCEEGRCVVVGVGEE